MLWYSPVMTLQPSDDSILFPLAEVTLPNRLYGLWGDLYEAIGPRALRPALWRRSAALRLRPVLNLTSPCPQIANRIRRRDLPVVGSSLPVASLEQLEFRL